MSGGFHLKPSELICTQSAVTHGGADSWRTMKWLLIWHGQKTSCWAMR